MKAKEGNRFSGSGSVCAQAVCNSLLWLPQNAEVVCTSLTTILQPRAYQAITRFQSQDLNRVTAREARLRCGCGSTDDVEVWGGGQSLQSNSHSLQTCPVSGRLLGTEVLCITQTTPGKVRYCVSVAIIYPSPFLRGPDTAWVFF